MGAPQLQAVPDEPIPAIGYIRVSLAREEMISPEIQRSAITEDARRTGRRIVRWITDLDKTGRNLKREIMDGVAAIEAGEAREVLIYRYDRWGRNAVESLANCRRVELAGGHVRSATEPLDPDTAIGRYSRTNAFALAEMQSDQIGENWRASHASRIARGLPAGGTPRFGYVRKGRVPAGDPGAYRWRRDPADGDGERYEPDPDTSGILAEMYRRYVDGSSGVDIAQWLNSRHIPTTGGSRWRRSSVLSVLDSAFGAGLLNIHDPECRCGDPMRCRRRAHPPGAHDAVITTDLWEAYQTRRTRMATTPARSRYPAYPLSGLVRCGHCGGPATIKAGRQPARYMACRARAQGLDCSARPCIPRHAIEDTVLDRLREWAVELDTRAETTRIRPAPASPDDTTRLERALAEIDQSLRRLLRQRVTGDGMPDEVYDELRDELLAEKTRIEAELAGARRTSKAGVTDHLPIIRGVLAEWDTLPSGRRNDLLRRLIRHVRIYREPQPHIEVTPLWETCPGPCCNA